MSRGNGFLQRRVLQLLDAAPGHRLSREELDRVLVGVEKHDASNLLRSIRALTRQHQVAFADRRRKKDSLVSLPRRVGHLTDDEIFMLIARMGDKE